MRIILEERGKVPYQKIDFKSPRKVFCFGDSNAAGAELQPHEHPFVHWVANTLNAPYENHGVCGASLGLILHSLVAKIPDITADDLVLVTIPPDIRWYDQNDDRGFFSLQTYERKEYFAFLNNKGLEWFRYHHALFIYSMQKILNDIGCTYILTHVYGQMDEYKHYGLKIDFTKFLSDVSMLNLLAETASFIWRCYPDHLPREHHLDRDGPDFIDRESKYFWPNDGHPNELGHQRIAELMVEKLYRDQ